jgi:hypothetical protein
MRVLFGLVMMQSSHAGDGTIKSMLGVARQGAAVVNRLGAASTHQAEAADYKGVIDHRGITTNCQGATVNHQGAIADRQDAAVDRQGAIIGRRVPPPTVRVLLILQR